MKKKKAIFVSCILGVALLIAGSVLTSQYLRGRLNMLRKDSTVLFIGDSITDSGRIYEQPDHLGWGCAMRVKDRIEQHYEGYNITFYNRGINGNTVRDVINRIQTDCIDLDPDYIVLLIGINNIWSSDTNKTFDSDYRELLDILKEKLPEAEVILISPFLLPTDSNRIFWRVNVDPKIATVSALAQEYRHTFIALDEVYAQSTENGIITPSQIASDGVHPTSLGYDIMAEEVLKALHADRALEVQ